ncbi:MAG: hypothetical protein SU899_03090 [Chloroflexota bacterium]|nr:hypothetical protein [Chloroflexota bacterium]
MKQDIKHGSYRKLLFGLTAILIGGMIAIVGCHATPTNTPSIQIPLAIPQRADFLAKVGVAEIMGNEALVELYEEIIAQNMTLPQTLDAALDTLEHTTGIDPKAFTTIIAFADVTALFEIMESAQNSGGLPYFGALIEGKLDESTFIRSIESKLGQELTTSSYQNYTVYAFANPHNQNQALSMTFLADGQIVIGATLAVKDVIDVTVGLQEPISGTVYDLYSQLDDALVKLASVVPESLTNQIPEEMPIGPINVNLLSLRDIRYTTFTLNGNANIFNADAHLEFTSSDSAKTSAQLLRLAITAGKYVISDPNIEELLSKVHLSRSGSSISLALALTTSEIERFTSAIFREAV